MKLKKSLILLSIFSISSCFSDYMISDDEAYRLGRELKITDICLSKSHVEVLNNLLNKPTIGIIKELQNFVLNTTGESVLGNRYHYIKRDQIFINSLNGKNHIYLKGQNDTLNMKLSSQYCKPYLDHYEGAYYRLKASGY